MRWAGSWFRPAARTRPHSSELATIQVRSGPSMIRDENGFLTGYVYVDLADRDPGSYIAEANAVLQQQDKAARGIRDELGWPV